MWSKVGHWTPVNHTKGESVINRTRLISVILVCVMVFALVPMSASADDASVIEYGIIRDNGSYLPWRLYDDGTLMVDGGNINWTIGGTRFGSPWSHLEDEELEDEYLEATRITRIIFTEEVTAVESLAGLFRFMSNVTSIEGLHYIDTSKVTNMNFMFANARSLTDLDLSSWDTSNVTDMNNMFCNTSGLTSLDLSNWDTSSLTNASEMFSFALNLRTLDLSSWNTENLQNMERMFFSMWSLASLDLSHFNTSNVTNMQDLFLDTPNLTNLNLSGWNTSKVTDMRWMFSSTGLRSLDLSDWDTSNVKDMSGMFAYTNQLTDLNLSHWNTSNVTDMNWMFAYSAVRNLNLHHLDTSNVTDMSGMFYNASSLTNLDLSGWNTSNVENMAWMFEETNPLLQLALGENFELSDNTGLQLGCAVPTLFIAAWFDNNTDGAERLTGAKIFNTTTNILNERIVYYVRPSGDFAGARIMIWCRDTLSPLN